MMYYVGMPGHVIVSGKLEECDRSHQAVWALQLPHWHRVREPSFSCWNEPKQNLGSIVKYGEADLVNFNKNSATLQLQLFKSCAGCPQVVRP